MRRAQALGGSSPSASVTICLSLIKKRCKHLRLRRFFVVCRGIGQSPDSHQTREAGVQLRDIHPVGDVREHGVKVEIARNAVGFGHARGRAGVQPKVVAAAGLAADTLESECRAGTRFQQPMPAEGAEDQAEEGSAGCCGGCCPVASRSRRVGERARLRLSSASGRGVVVSARASDYGPTLANSRRNRGSERIGSKAGSARR
jgi:hypothetical protein